MDVESPTAANDDASAGGQPPPEGSSAAWAKFDAAWYLRTYPPVRSILFDLSEASVLAYYLAHGQQRGHSPNPFFDERVFLHSDRTAADAVRGGAAASGFELYCRNRGEHRKPHWLFDEAYYRHLYPDLTDASLVESSLVNGYDHLLRHGAREYRSGSPFFDAHVYLAGLEPVEAERAESLGCYVAYLASLPARDGADRQVSHYFDPAWYLAKYPEVADIIAKRGALSALHHYLTNDTATSFDPLPEFSEQAYLRLYPDVATAVENATFHNGYEHFLYHGVFEKRQPSDGIDLNYYVATHRSVRDDLRRGLARDAFAHYLHIGRAQGLNTIPLPDEIVTEGQASRLFGMRAQMLAPLLTRRRLDFSCEGEPALTAIMAICDGFALTLQTLSSLRANFAGAIELILIDLGSTDASAEIERCLVGATVLRFDVDIGTLQGRNAGIQGACADTLLLLDNGVELAPGAIAAALDRLAADARIGAVGGKVVGVDGRLAEAGCIAWRDGSTRAYQQGAPPSVPEANFARVVDFCSSGFLMARAELLQTLEGYVTDYPRGTCEDVDLGLRITASGHRVVYDPQIVVHRLTSVPSASATDMTEARAVFLQRCGNDIGARHIASPAAEVFARTAGALAAVGGARRRVLVLVSTVPLRMLGGGAVRANEIITTMAAMGADVTVFPVSPHSLDLAVAYADIPDTVELMHDRTIEDLADFLGRRAGFFDVVWIAGAAVLDQVRPILAAAMATGGKPPRLILDVAGIAALQAARRAALSETGEGGGFDLDGAVAAEFVNASFCNQIVAVNDLEAGLLSGLDFDAVPVIGPVQTPAPTPLPFQERSGLLFVGAIETSGTPNHDSLCWLVDDVLPLIEQTLGWETRLTIVGPCDDAAALDRFRLHPRVTLRGKLVDVTSLYDSHRIFVAPTRFGAGLPYKVYEAASHGLPVVASGLVSGQMGWQDEHELLAAPVSDAQGFAERIVGLYRDEARWQRLRDAALARLAAENSPVRAAAALKTLLG